jgi:hypothetical protein
VQDATWEGWYHLLLKEQNLHELMAGIILLSLSSLPENVEEWHLAGLDIRYDLDIPFISPLNQLWPALR